MTGCTKTVVKNTIETIGQYLIDNSEKIAGDFDGMTEFELEVKFRTNDDEGTYWPEIRFTNQHFMPWTEELEKKIFETEEGQE